jgi:hypothetical protein
MRAHIFNVDEKTFPVHRDREFCGTGKIGFSLTNYQQVLDKQRTFSDLIADLKGTRPGDLVFFYERRRGFHGIYQVISPPFFDPQEIFGIGEFSHHKVGADVAFRLPVKCVDYYPEPVPEDLIFSTPTYERIFWIPFYRKIQGPRGCVTIDPEATRTLLELLIKLNGPPQEKEFHPFYYDPDFDAVEIPFASDSINIGSDEIGPFIQFPQLQLLNLPLTPKKPVPLEAHLRDWLVSHLDNPSQPDLRRLFGPISHIEWFANNVPFHVSQRHIDLLVYHKTPLGELIDPALRYRYSVVELKRDQSKPEDVDQLMGYVKWVANRLADGEADIVHPYIIAQDFQKETISRASSIKFNRTGIQLVKYEVVSEDQIAFQDVQQLKNLQLRFGN